MSEKMAEEGNAAGPSGIVKIKDNFVKITKDRKRVAFILTKSIEMICCFVAAVAESYKSLFSEEYRYPPKIPAYKNLERNSDFPFRIICIALDGFFIINLILLITYLIGEQLSKRLLWAFSLVGALYCFSAGGILISDHGDSNNLYNNYNNATDMVVSGTFAIIAGLVFLVETFITYKFFS